MNALAVLIECVAVEISADGVAVGLTQQPGIGPRWFFERQNEGSFRLLRLPRMLDRWFFRKESVRSRQMPVGLSQPAESTVVKECVDNLNLPCVFCVQWSGFA